MTNRCHVKQMFSFKYKHLPDIFGRFFRISVVCVDFCLIRPNHFFLLTRCISATHIVSPEFGPHISWVLGELAGFQTSLLLVVPNVIT